MKSIIGGGVAVVRYHYTSPNSTTLPPIPLASPIPLRFPQFHYASPNSTTLPPIPLRFPQFHYASPNSTTLPPIPLRFPQFHYASPNSITLPPSRLHPPCGVPRGFQRGHGPRIFLTSFLAEGFRSTAQAYPGNKHPYKGSGKGGAGGHWPVLKCWGRGGPRENVAPPPQFWGPRENCG